MCLKAYPCPFFFTDDCFPRSNPTVPWRLLKSKPGTSKWRTTPSVRYIFIIQVSPKNTFLVLPPRLISKNTLIWQMECLKHAAPDSMGGLLSVYMNIQRNALQGWQKPSSDFFQCLSRLSWLVTVRRSYKRRVSTWCLRSRWSCFKKVSSLTYRRFFWVFLFISQKAETKSLMKLWNEIRSHSREKHYWHFLMCHNLLRTNETKWLT